MGARFQDGELEESELAFWAQDADGNVWHLGEYPEEYGDGNLVKSPGWIEGEHGAEAGIQMMAEPAIGGPSYAQGYAPPPLNWVDRGRTFDIGVEICVPVDCYVDVLVIEEFERTNPERLSSSTTRRGSATSESTGVARTKTKRRSSSWSRTGNSATERWKRFATPLLNSTSGRSGGSPGTDPRRR